MSKKNKPGAAGYVYSTNPDFRLEEEQQEVSTLPAGNQLLKVKLDTKHRAGKAVTVVSGFSGTAADMEVLGKKLKSHCGTGGAVKDGEIMVQGDQRDKVYQWLLAQGYSRTKKIG